MENEEVNQINNATETVEGKKAPYPGLAVAIVLLTIVVGVVIVGSVAYSLIANANF